MTTRAQRHEPRNVNTLHKVEQGEAGFNQRLAVLLTRLVGTMPTAYFFAALAFVGLCGILGLLNPVVILLVTWLSQTFLQLVFLPILSVGQNVLGRHAELLAEEQYRTTQKTYDDTEKLMALLADIEKQHAEILQLLKGQESDDDHAINRILMDLSSAIGKCKTVEEAQRLVWRIASREEAEGA